MGDGGVEDWSVCVWGGRESVSVAAGEGGVCGGGGVPIDTRLPEQYGRGDRGACGQPRSYTHADGVGGD